MGKPSVTVHIAEPGTPKTTGKPSGPGHMWYELHDGKGGKPASYGFAPINSVPIGKGDVFYTDTETYLDRVGMRTFEISQSQFNDMRNFGNAPRTYGFNDITYNAGTNSCIDFTWKALEVGGFELPSSLIGTYDGELYPVQNVEPLKKLPGKEIPYPGEIDYMKGKKDKRWGDGRKGSSGVLGVSSQLGGSKQAQLCAICDTVSVNFATPKKNSKTFHIVYAMLDNAIDTAKQTNFNGVPAYLLAQTTQPTCYGDETGLGGGVISGTIGQEVKPTLGSSTIYVEGKSLVRQGDTCTMNNGNTTGSYVLV